MKIAKEDYKESLEYLKDINNKNFFNNMKERLEKLSLEYKNADDRKKQIERDLGKDKELIKKDKEHRECIKKMKEVTITMREIVNPYKKDFFRSHINRVIAYKEDVDIEDTSDISIIWSNFNKDKEYQLVINAIEIINSVFINPTVLSALYGNTRQYINLLLTNNKIKSTVIGHVTAFKMIDVI